ncbi:MAG: transcription antitermination factor NusB [Gemmatimonadota bacterium]
MGGAVVADGGDARLSRPGDSGDGGTLARRCALRVLRDVSGGALLDRSAARRFSELDTRDRAWAVEAAFGTTRLRGRLDAALAPHLAGKALDPAVRDVLRLGVYQLKEMGGVPPYAAVSESVGLARASGRGRAAGLVNAVLHRVAEADYAPPPTGSDTLTALATWGSHPRWLLERWLARYGADATAALVDANNRRPELYIRLIGDGVDAALRRLAGVGIDAERVALEPRSLRLPAGTDLGVAFGAARAIVQDPAASAAVRYAALPQGHSIADLCAAPGGKSFALLDLGAGRVTPADRSRSRLRSVVDTAERLGLRGGSTGAASAPSPAGLLGPVAADACAPPFAPGDAVLLDAPCTGTGTLRRHPDGRWRVGPADLASLAALQARMLDAAADAVAPGGLLIYATCSLEPEENEEQVDRFLADNEGFRLDPPAGSDVPVCAQGYLRVLPQEQGVDGSFAARLRRAASC